MQYKCGKMKRFWSLTLSYCQAHADVSVQVEWITAVSGSLPSLYSFMCRLDHVTQLYKWTLSNRNIQGIINRGHFFLRSFLYKQEMTDSLYFFCLKNFLHIKRYDKIEFNGLNYLHLSFPSLATISILLSSIPHNIDNIHLLN